MKSLKEYTREIEKAELTKARIQGKISAEEKRLKIKFKVKSLNEAHKTLARITKKYEKKTKELKKGLLALEKKYDLQD